MPSDVNCNAFRLNNRKASLSSRAKSGLRTTKAKRMFSFCRWLHIYISCALFLLLLFFCITGVTLNHPEWTGSTQTEIQQIALPNAVIFDDDGEYRIKSIQAYIEQSFNLSSPRSIDIAMDMGEMTFDYPLPAGYAFVTVIIEENIVELEYASNGFLGLLNDLHKGRHSGYVWSLVIDISAILVAFFSLTGVVILLQNAKHRKQAFLVILLGSITPVAIYLLAVPQL
jgi:hypothetical protein